VDTPPYDISPLRRWTRDDIGAPGRRDLVVALSGALPSHFAQSKENSGEAGPARVIVSGGASFITDQFFASGNEALLLNMVDWLLRDDALLAIRTRGLQAAPLAEVADSTRNAVKYTNILGVPFLAIAFGLARWRRRERRRSRARL